MQFGLLTNLIEDLSAYIAGNSPLPRIEYNETGNWEDYLPKYEAQKDKFESQGCTLWALHNAIETFYKFLYKVEPNYDEWFNYPIIPIKEGGQDPHVTFESIRKHGLVDAGTVAIPNTRKQALDLNRITGSMRAKAQNWLLRHDFRHEYVWDNRPTDYMAVLQRELKLSPLAVSVTAWRLVNGSYVSDSGGNNHLCLLYKFDEEGHPWIFDTYDHSKKRLSKDHNIRRAKRIWLQRKDIAGMQQHIGVLTRILNRLRMKKTLLEVCKENIGKDASPRDLAPDSLGCAESVTTLLKQIYPETPIITGTITLFEWLSNPKNGWKETTTPTPECIVISHTGSGNGTRRGHTGVLDEHLNIMSNSSLPPTLGKWIINFSIDTWRKDFVVQGGMQMRFFTRA